MNATRTLLAAGLLVIACAAQANAQAMPDHVRKALDRFVGKWQAEEVMDGKTTKAELEAEWTPDKSALSYWARRGLIGQMPTTASGTLGWDGKAKVVRERNFSADGSTFEAEHAIEAGIKEWKSPSRGSSVKDGGLVAASATRVIVWKGDDEWEVKINDRKIDGNNAPPIVSTWRRAKSAAERYLDFWKPLVGNWKTRAEVDGKVVAGTYSSELVENKSCYLSSGTGPEPAGSGLAAYDPVARCWKSVGFNTAGDSDTLLVRIANLEQLKTVQAGAKGTYQTYRALANGATESSTGDWNFPSWDDKQHVLELTNVIKNGQPQPNVKIHYERQP